MHFIKILSVMTFVREPGQLHIIMCQQYPEKRYLREIRLFDVLKCDLGIDKR